MTCDWDILEINKSKWHGFHTEKCSYLRLVLLSWSGICTICLVLQVAGGPGRWWQLSLFLNAAHSGLKYSKNTKGVQQGDTNHYHNLLSLTFPYLGLPQPQLCSHHLSGLTHALQPPVALRLPSPPLQSRVLLHPPPPASQPFSQEEIAASFAAYSTGAKLWSLCPTHELPLLTTSWLFLKVGNSWNDLWAYVQYWAIVASGLKACIENFRFSGTHLSVVHHTAALYSQ